MNKNNITIYGVKNNDSYHYIGKTGKNINEDGTKNKSKVTRQYSNDEVKHILKDNNVVVVPLETVNNKNWYRKKLIKVVEKYKEGNPLLNASWMLNGNRGYWQGLKRDENTLKRLSESKFKEVMEFDKDGNLKNIWKSAKEPAIKVFNDYRIVNGSANTKLYSILGSNTLKSKFALGSYWLYKNEIKDEYLDPITLKLNIQKILEYEKNKRKEWRKRLIVTEMKIYTVNQYDDNGEIIKTYLNVNEAANNLHTSKTTIKRICRNMVKKPKFKLKYGEKIKQKIKF